jgi:hypothetical protein
MRDGELPQTLHLNIKQSEISEEQLVMGNLKLFLYNEHSHVRNIY